MKLLLVAFLSISSFNLCCLATEMEMVKSFCENPSGSKIAKLPDIPNTYRVSIDVTSTVGTGGSVYLELSELRDGPNGQNGIFMWTKGLKTYQWIFNTKTKPNFFRVDNSNVCVNHEEKDLDSPPPFEFSGLWVQKSEKIPTSVADFFTLVNSSKTVAIYNNTDQDYEHVHGLNVSHFTVCQEDLETSTVRELTFCFAPKDFASVDPKIKEELLLIDAKIFNKSKTGNYTYTDKNIIYEFSGWRSSVRQEHVERMLSPPSGVFCNKLDVTKEFPTVVDRFTVAIDHFNLQTKVLDYVHVNYDSKEKLISFIYTQETKSDEPFDLGFIGKEGRYRIVHDFKTGIEYVINEEMDTCHNVSQIPKHAGDVQVSTGKSLLYSMKNATDILFNRNSVNWTYSEKLYGDILTDVWTYEVQEDFENYTTTYEVFFTTNDWEVNGPFGDHKTKSAVPLAMKIYRHSTLEPILTVQHFHDFVPYVEHNLPSDAFCVEACADGGYSLVVQLNTTKSTIQNFGTSAVRNQLQSDLAAKSGVRLIRISSIEIETLGKNQTTFLTFKLLNSSNIEGLNVEGVEKELSSEEAQKKLTDSLTKSDVPVTVVNGKEKLFLALKTKTLQSAVYYFDPNGAPPVPVNPVINVGYTGSSMAGLGICMLIIGSGMGVAGAWYIWKRNRGIAYQVYE